MRSAPTVFDGRPRRLGGELECNTSGAPFVSHVELYWAMPEFKAFFDQLSTFCRVLVFDEAGD
jgi:hypothetical protein